MSIKARAPNRCTLSGAAIGSIAAAFVVVATLPAHADESRPPSLNLYGVPGLMDTPDPASAPDGMLSYSFTGFAKTRRYNIAFQITPRLSGAFRYSIVKGSTADRSFDVRYQLLRESGWRPDLAVGLRDFMGTGLYSGEYIVASKTVLPGLRLTGGIGWGRYSGTNPLGSTGTRPVGTLGTGGIPSYNKWFRGPYSAFGGISYSPSERLTFKAEYSPDTYSREVTNGFTRKNDWNFGIDYRLKKGGQISLYHLHGGETALLLSFHSNLRSAPFPGGSEQAPVPVYVRDRANLNDLGWTTDTRKQADTRKTMAEALDREKLTYEGLKLEPRRAVLRVNNRTYGATPEAYGRAARVMSRVLPASIEEFVIVPMANGMPTTAVTFQRSDIEKLENALASELLARTSIRDGFGTVPAPENGVFPRLRWSLAPYVALQVFDPSDPIRVDTGLRFSANYQPHPNIVISGSITKKIAGNLNSSVRVDPTLLPAVRTDGYLYARQGDPAIEHLTFAYYGRPAPDFYSRLTLGYLEPMYAGASAELLWKPVASRLALGIEVNAVRPRAFDQLFGLRSPKTATGRIPTFNGQVSAYYSFRNGFYGQVDAGRFLAGDYGARFTLMREFANGWRVGAYATFTDVSATTFGEGSFDKGIIVSIPLSWVVGKPSRKTNTVTLQSLRRDGGARLDVHGRLYEKIRDYDRPTLEQTWGRVWR